ncbi:MAG TPA: GDSL-type esterase/lipase family protein, partial [Candidatus Saccharimonadales bacterium]|nr:GDSL-type esterase/lipase family protein [Candidatus Saccharimonadales bacterium]
MSCITALVVLSILEAGARVAGYRPWSIRRADIVVEPGQTFYQSHPSLGYTHLPGHFKVTLSGSYVFTATHLTSTLRITQPLATLNQQGTLRDIWMFGDSITYGWSVNDEESYAWLLHEKIPEHRVVNFGVGGYGTVHALIQLREALSQQQPPQLAIVTYASWHDPRNTLIRIRRKMLLPSSHLGALHHPYAQLTADGKIEIVDDSLAYREFPLMRYSAFMHAVEEAYNSY